MGTWGTGPFDTDDAVDMLADIVAPIRKCADAKSDDRASYFYNQARAAAAIVVQAHGRDILGGTDLDLVLVVLQRIRSDEKFVNGYRDPKKIVAALDAEIEGVKLAKLRGAFWVSSLLEMWRDRHEDLDRETGEEEP